MPTNICFAARRRVTHSAVMRDSYLLVRRSLRRTLSHFNDATQPPQKVHRLMRSQPVLVEQRQDVVDDRVLGLSQQVRLREGGFRNAGAGILAARLGDDVIEVVLRAEALRSRTSTIEAISYILEMVASSRDMVSHLGRSVLMAYTRMVLLHHSLGLDLVVGGLPHGCYSD